MNPAKIRLSAKETELINNADWILTKNGILQKVNLLFVEVQGRQEDMLKENASLISADILASTAKISRGENYRGLPYLVLDYPRLFSKADSFAIRTMFWWGNFFSITLHLSGQSKEEFAARISAAYELLCADFFYCLNQEQWEHHFGADNYVPVRELSPKEFADCIKKQPFIKIAAKFSLEKWEEAEEKLVAHFSFLVNLLVT